MKPVIVGCRTTHFTPEQLAVFKRHQPFGMIVFSEPGEQGPDTVRHVVDQFTAVCPHARIFMDAEGGRVNRLKAEFGHGWRDVPPARAFATLAMTDLPKACEAITLNAQLIAFDLMALGVNGNCAPVVDLVSEEVILEVGDDGKPHATSASLYQRSFGDDPAIVTSCAKAFADGLHSLGVVSVLKHAPGYGRVTLDPHYNGVTLDASLEDMLATDLVPYKILRNYPAVMTAHTFYTAIDPDHVATLSRIVLQDIMRDKIGFTGVIIADTIEMNSLDPDGFSKTEKCHFGMGLPLPGTLSKLTKAALAAGCDLVLHSDCSRNFQDTIDILESAPVLDDAKASWLLNKMTVEKTAHDFDPVAARARLDVLMSLMFQLKDHSSDMIAATVEELTRHINTLLGKRAVIEHVGATSIPGCLTKGDIDFCLLVEQDDFAACRRILEHHFDINEGSTQNEYFCSFNSTSNDIDIGLQLTVRHSPLDIFILFRDRLRADRVLVKEYNTLKRHYDGLPMQDYRRAKEIFVEKVLSQTGNASTI